MSGENNRFGQKVWCDILVKPEPVRLQPIPQIFEVKERSSLLDDESMIMEKPIVQEPFFKFIEVKQEQVSNEAEQENFEDMKPAAELAQSQIDEEPVAIQEEAKEEDPVPEV